MVGKNFVCIPKPKIKFLSRLLQTRMFRKVWICWCMKFWMRFEMFKTHSSINLLWHWFYVYFKLGPFLAYMGVFMFVLLKFSTNDNVKVISSPMVLIKKCKNRSLTFSKKPSNKPGLEPGLLRHKAAAQALAPQQLPLTNRYMFH